MLEYVSSNKDKIRYNTRTGQLDRLFKSGWRQAGKSINSAGYHTAQYCGKVVPVHQIVADIFNWTGVVDHIDRDRLNNKLCNLRPVSVAYNRHNRGNTNNRVLPVGIRWTGHAFQARIRKDGKLHSLGSYSTLEGAKNAYATAKAELLSELATQAQ